MFYGNLQKDMTLFPGCYTVDIYPLVISHSHGIDGPFIDDFPINTSIYKGFSMAMLVITRG